MKENKPGDSTTQSQAEAVIRAELEKKLGLMPDSLTDNRPNSLGTLILNGFQDGERPICVEIWAHQGKAKSAQQAKVMKDFCKLLLAEKRLAKYCRKIFAVCDEEAISHLKNSWQGEFAKAFDIEFLVVAIDDSIKQEIRHAQKKQYR